ncbi:MAG TPA: transglycosylase SLT domain-containing protein [Thermoleophilaceae bacterium]|nr:transglycosylase SLT domain-containing protein [Thermoleophilaceae bacterium]
MKLRTSLVVGSSIVLLAASATAAEGQVPHTVQPGESLWSIAAANGLSADELAAANGLSSEAGLIAGTTVLIPPASASTPPAASGTGECVWDCASSAHPHPTDETVTPEQVGAIAAKYGMSPALVQSIAWNESAFDNSLVSSAGARGVMQIIPDTWEFVDGQLVTEPLDPTSASNNVEAGAAYLHYLYHLKGDDGDAAVASYYQGPNRETLLPETETYVREVREDEQDFAGG